MALQANIPLQGGISHNNGYVRVTNARLCRKDNEDDFIISEESALACLSWLSIVS